MYISSDRIKIYFLFILLSAVVFNVQGKEYIIQGQIYDIKTNERLNNATIRLLNIPDSSIIAETEDKPLFRPNNTAADFFDLKFVAKKGDTMNLQLIIEQPGYKTEKRKIDFTKDFPSVMNLGQLYVMKYNDGDDDMMKALDEFTVTATKIKMVVRGDTIVYNADAFNLAEGSMLDALISRLPGVELKDNGQITVNGKFVNSLLLDGKDFFKGDPNVALKNLPAYIVKNIKVYDHTEESALAFGKKQQTDENLVLDVILKKQYQKGLVANFEGGYGSSKRYMGRAFLFEYAKNGRIAFYGGINNINNTSRGPGVYSDGWENIPPLNTGERKIIKAGVDFMWDAWQGKDDPKAHLTFQGWGEYMGSDRRQTTFESSTEFLNPGNVFGRSRTDSRDRMHRFYTSHRWTYQSADFSKPNNIFVTVLPVFMYEKSKGFSYMTYGKFDINPVETKMGEAIDSIKYNIDGYYAHRYGLVYREENDSKSERSRVYTTGTSNVSIRNEIFSNRFFINAYFNWKYDHIDTHRKDIRDVSYADPLVPGYNLNQHITNPSKEIEIDPSVKLSCRFNNNVTFQTTYRFLHEYRKGIREIYVLDDPFATLEESRIDLQNSYYSRFKGNTHTVTPRLSLDLNRGNTSYWIMASADINIADRRLKYLQADIDTITKSKDVYVSPKIYIEISNNDNANHKITVNVEKNDRLADMTKMIPTVDNSNPLAVYLGNPDLNNEKTYSADIKYQLSGLVAGQILTLSGNYKYVQDRITNMRLYDPATGVNTYLPVNVSGSYSANGQVDFTTPLGKSNRIYFTTTTRIDFIHNPTFTSESTLEAAKKFAVKNRNIGELLKLQWSVASGYSLSFNVGTTWRNATADSHAFTKINAIDTKAGLTASLNLPYSFSLSTDFNVYNRSGYNDNSLNTTDFVWNARLQRSWLKGRLTTSIDAYDLLGQLSNVTTTINSLGQTETWTNSLRQYIMLTIGFNFSIQPSK